MGDVARAVRLAERGAILSPAETEALAKAAAAQARRGDAPVRCVSAPPGGRAPHRERDYMKELQAEASEAGRSRPAQRSAPAPATETARWYLLPRRARRRACADRRPQRPRTRVRLGASPLTRRALARSSRPGSCRTGTPL